MLITDRVARIGEAGAALAAAFCAEALAIAAGDGPGVVIARDAQLGHRGHIDQLLYAARTARLFASGEPAPGAPHKTALDFERDARRTAERTLELTQSALARADARAVRAEKRLAIAIAQRDAAVDETASAEAELRIVEGELAAALHRAEAIEASMGAAEHEATLRGAARALEVR